MSPETAGNVLLVVAWLPAVLSVAVYARVPWRRSELGRHLMSYMVIVALTLSLGVVRIVWEPSWFWSLRMAAFALFVGVTWWRLALIVQAQVESWRAASGGDVDDGPQDPPEPPGGPVTPPQGVVRPRDAAREERARHADQTPG